MGSVSGEAGKGDGKRQPLSSEENTNPFMWRCGKGIKSPGLFQGDNPALPFHPRLVRKALGWLWRGEFQGFGHSCWRVPTCPSISWHDTAFPSISGHLLAHPSTSQHLWASPACPRVIPTSQRCLGRSQGSPRPPLCSGFVWWLLLGWHWQHSELSVTSSAHAVTAADPNQQLRKTSRNCPQSWVIFCCFGAEPRAWDRRRSNE